MYGGDIPLQEYGQVDCPVTGRISNQRELGLW